MRGSNARASRQSARAKTMRRPFYQAFHRGAHYYNGRRSSRGQRLWSKINKGIKPVRAKVWRAIEEELTSR